MTTSLITAFSALLVSAATSSATAVSTFTASDASSASAAATESTFSRRSASLTTSDSAAFSALATMNGYHVNIKIDINKNITKLKKSSFDLLMN